MNGNWTWSEAQWTVIVKEALLERAYRAHSKRPAFNENDKRMYRRWANQCAARLRNAAHRAEYSPRRPTLTLI